MRRTKIVATVGPATSEPDAMRRCSTRASTWCASTPRTATADVHAERAALARGGRRRLGRTVGVLVDLPGPKMRTGPVVDDEVELESTRTFVLTVDADRRRRAPRVDDHPRTRALGARRRRDLPRRRRDRAARRADRRRRRRVRGRARRRAPIAQGHARSAAPKATSSRSPTPTRSRCEMAIGSRPTSSACRSCAARRHRGRPRPPAEARRRPHLVAKIETAVALDHLAGIVATADAVMVARGDLGIQVPARRRAADPEGDHPLLQHGGEAGDHRDADARVDDPLAAADPRRGERRRQRGDRRHRRARCSRRRPRSASIPTDTVRTMADVAEAAEGWPSARVDPAGRGRRDRRRPGRVGGRARGGAGRRGPRRRRDRVPDAERHDRAPRRRVPADGADRRHLRPDRSARPAVPRVGRAPARRSIRPTTAEPSSTTRSRAARDAGIVHAATSSRSCRRRRASAPAAPTPSESSAPDPRTGVRPPMAVSRRFERGSSGGGGRRG